MAHLLPPEQANDRRQADHRAENDPLRGIGIVEVFAKPQGRDRYAGTGTAERGPRSRARQCPWSGQAVRDPSPTGMRKSINTENMKVTNKSAGQRQAVIGPPNIGRFKKLSR